MRVQIGLGEAGADLADALVRLRVLVVCVSNSTRTARKEEGTVHVGALALAVVAADYGQIEAVARAGHWVSRAAYNSPF